MTASGLERERDRQEQLLQAVFSRPGHSLQAWVRPQLSSSSDPTHADAQRGLAAYISHGFFTAERALGAAYPTVKALVGPESFALLARAFWKKFPPLRGDLGWFGEALALFIAEDDQLVDVPYLSDMAQLDWAVTRAETAPDTSPDKASFQLLGAVDPAGLGALFASGAALIPSAWPIVTLWQAHQQPDSEGAFDGAKQALQSQVAEKALVWRSGWKPQVRAVTQHEFEFLLALLAGSSLEQALVSAGDDFDFALCLQQGVLQGWWAAVKTL